MSENPYQSPEAELENANSDASYSTMTIEAKKISKKSFFKLLLIAFSIGFFLFFLINGIAAVFGAQTVSYEGSPITGIKGLLFALIIWPIFSVIFTTIFWLLGVFGLWIYSFFSPLRITFKGAVRHVDTEAE